MGKQQKDTCWRFCVASPAIVDFTLHTYKRLLETLLAQNFTVQTFAAFMQTPANRVIVLRHDVDRCPGNALKMAKMEHELGITSSYYFRAMPKSWNEGIIRKISSLRHEIGYHYESLSASKGDMKLAFSDFNVNLERLRTIAPVKTICMHGSPLSRINNLDLWKIYDYKGLGIVGEPYLDVDYLKVFYLTDTGRKWNNVGASVRDTVESGFDIMVRDTFQLMELAGQRGLPDKMMINVHPHRWFVFGAGWLKELVGQNIKNVVKSAIVRMRN